MARMSNTCFDVSIKQSLHFVIFLVRQNYKSIRKQINIWKLWPMKSRQEIFLYYKFMSCHAVYTLYRILLQNYSHLHTKPVTLYSIETDVGDAAVWNRHMVSLPTGNFRVIFTFRMGLPFECGAALDDVQMVSCTQIGSWVTPEDMAGRNNGDVMLDVLSECSITISIPVYKDNLPVIGHLKRHHDGF